MKLHAGQWYATDWSRQRVQRPIFACPQLGHGNVVVPLPSSTAPQEVQRLSSGLTSLGTDGVYKTLWSASDDLDFHLSNSIIIAIGEGTVGPSGRGSAARNLPRGP